MIFWWAGYGCSKANYVQCLQTYDDVVDDVVLRNKMMSYFY
jgi:hypothetical protein